MKLLIEHAVTKILDDLVAVYAILGSDEGGKLGEGLHPSAIACRTTRTMSSVSFLTQSPSFSQCGAYMSAPSA